MQGTVILQYKAHFYTMIHIYFHPFIHSIYCLSVSITGGAEANPRRLRADNLSQGFINI